MLNVRRESVSEPGLLADDIPARQIRALFFQPDALEDGTLDAAMRAAGLRNEAPSDLIGRLSKEIGLEATGLTLFGRKGRRTVIGCSKHFGHVLAPDRSAISLAIRVLSRGVGSWFFRWRLPGIGPGTRSVRSHSGLRVK